jgi:hypothetical protein
MSLREAAQQALEALVAIEEDPHGSHSFPALANDAITALRTALSEPEQEPVAWLQRRFVDNFPAPGYETCEATDYGAIPVYTHPPQRKPLTDEEIALIVGECAASAHRHDDFSFARAIERAHGIGGEA